jgi:excisionase family DNA binding protein
MISTEGMLTVAEAAQRLHRSEEQVRRNLRQGKLKSQRIGNQWFLGEAAISRPGHQDSRPLIPLDLQEQIARTREEIYRRGGIVFDFVKEVHEDRAGR